MVVYVVMDGCIDDYHIANIFKTEEKANKWIEEQGVWLYKPWIESWEVYGKTRGVTPRSGGR